MHISSRQVANKDKYYTKLIVYITFNNAHQTTYIHVRDTHTVCVLRYVNTLHLLELWSRCGSIQLATVDTTSSITKLHTPYSYYCCVHRAVGVHIEPMTMALLS